MENKDWIGLAVAVGSAGVVWFSLGRQGVGSISWPVNRERTAGWLGRALEGLRGWKAWGPGWLGGAFKRVNDSPGPG